MRNRPHPRLAPLPISLLLLTLLLPGTALAEQRIAFVNPQQIIIESKLGQTAQLDLGRIGREKDRIIRENAARIADLEKELDGSGLMVAEQQLKAKALEARYREHDRLVADSNEELRDEEHKLIQFILRQADSIIRQIAHKEGYAMVFSDPTTVSYVDERYDITKEVIRLLDAGS